MNVSDILDLMADFSAGGSNVTPTQRVLFLRYLNLAHHQLYSETALFNEAVFSTQTFNDVYNAVTGVVIPFNPFLVSSVFDLHTRCELSKKSHSEALKLYGRRTGRPFCFSASLQVDVPSFTVFLHPAPVRAHALITWVQEAIVLTAETPSYNIPYPSSFHHILVDGALWYVFQEEGGFKDNLKAKESKERWERGKQQVISFLFNSFEDQGREASNV